MISPTALERIAQLQVEIDTRHAEMETLTNAANRERVEKGLAALAAAGAWLAVDSAQHSSLKTTFHGTASDNFQDFYPLFGFGGYHDSIDADVLPELNITIEADDELLHLIVWHNRHKNVNEATWPADIAITKAYFAARGFKLNTERLDWERDNYMRLAAEMQKVIKAIHA